MNGAIEAFCLLRKSHSMSFWRRVNTALGFLFVTSVLDGFTENPILMFALSSDKDQRKMFAFAFPLAWCK